MPEFAYYIVAALLIGMPCAMEIGRRVRLAKGPRPSEAADPGTGALDAAVYGLFGLLLAFAFSGAAIRFDHRIDLVIQETNAIGTAYLRVDLLPPETQTRLRPLFRQYVKSRLATFHSIGNPEAVKTEYRRDMELQGEIWRQAVAGAHSTGNPAVISLTLSALNDMIDITTTRWAALSRHPPRIIYIMLLALAFSSSFLAGSAMARSGTRPLAHILTFYVVISATVYVILDIEFPRLGFIRVDAADQLLVDLLDSMK